MLENYRRDCASKSFKLTDISEGKYNKIFSIKKTHNINITFVLTAILSNVLMSSKKITFVSGGSPNLYDYDIENTNMKVKLFDDGTNYILYASISDTTNIGIKITQCDSPNLIKFYHGEAPSVLPSEGDITKRVVANKSTLFLSILSLINFTMEKQYTTQLTLTDTNEISGHLFVKGNQSGDGSVICTLPTPLYITTESLFQTFTAMYESTDGLWYGCTLRLEQDGTLKVYGLGSNAPTYVSIKANIHYRCSKNVINTLLN